MPHICRWHYNSFDLVGAKLWKSLSLVLFLNSQVELTSTIASPSVSLKLKLLMYLFFLHIFLFYNSSLNITMRTKLLNLLYFDFNFQKNSGRS